MKVVYRTWWFSPVYAMATGEAEHLEARDLEDAFVRAHVRWPSAHGWHCHGRVDARCPERATKVDAGIREMIVRETTARASAKKARS